MMMQTTRRALLAAAAVPAVIAAAPALALNIGSAADPQWTGLLADYHTKRVAWLDTIDDEENLSPEVDRAWEALPAEPKDPGSGLPADITNMTIAQISAASDTPEHKVAWATYKRDHAAWKAQRDAIRDEIVAPAKERYDTRYAAYATALNALADRRPRSLQQLGEKIDVLLTDYESFDLPLDYVRGLLADVRHLAAETAA